VKLVAQFALPQKSLGYGPYAIDPDFDSLPNEGTNAIGSNRTIPTIAGYFSHAIAWR
jgi:hypothetical protein